MKNFLKKKILKYLDKLGWGFCTKCSGFTNQKNQFCDDAEEDEQGHWHCTGAYTDYCHHECFEIMNDRAD